MDKKLCTDFLNVLKKEYSQFSFEFKENKLILSSDTFNLKVVNKNLYYEVETSDQETFKEKDLLDALVRLRFQLLKHYYPEKFKYYM